MQTLRDFRFVKTEPKSKLKIWLWLEHKYSFFLLWCQPPDLRYKTLKRTKKTEKRQCSLCRLDCVCPVNELVSRCLHLWRAPKGPRIWSSLPTTCTCYLIEHQNLVLLLFWVLSAGQIQFLWVMEWGWQDIQVNQNTPHLFIRRNICLEISLYKEPLQVSGNWAKTSKYISPHLRFT